MPAIPELLPFALVLLASQTGAAQTQSPDVAKSIRDEAFQHSHIMDTVGYLTDVVGPRLTQSSNLLKAEVYARDRLREWGLENAHLESWGPFGRGWELEGFTANLTSPGFSPLIAYPKAWSPSTNGAVRGEVVFLDVKTPSDLDKYKGKLRNKVVLFFPAMHVDPLFAPPPERRTNVELQRLAAAPAQREARPFQFTPEQRAAANLNDLKWQLIRNEGAAEQYNRVIRLVLRGLPVELEVAIAAKFNDSDSMSYLACGYWSYRQRCGRGYGAGGDAHAAVPAGETPSDHSNWTLDRGRARQSRFAFLCSRAPGPQGGV